MTSKCEVDSVLLRTRMGEDMTSNCKSESAPLRVRLEQLEREGIKLFFNGVPSTTEYIVENCIREDTVYMPDYVTDEYGRIKEIRYDKVSADQ